MGTAVDVDRATNAEELIEQAAACYRANDLAGAERQARAALDLEPEHCRAHTVLSTLFLVRKRWSEAEREARAALAMNNASVVARTNLG